MFNAPSFSLHHCCGAEIVSEGAGAAITAPYPCRFIEDLKRFYGKSHGGRAVFLKNLRVSLFDDIYRMKLILAGSISLDSTFKVPNELYVIKKYKGRKMFVKELER
jgi:hypothetical protein